jgi:hypothetical protein
VTNRRRALSVPSRNQTSLETAVAKDCIRYKYGTAQDAESDAIEIKAATFDTAGALIDFYSDSTMGASVGFIMPRGRVIFRVNGAAPQGRRRSARPCGQ